MHIFRPLADSLKEGSEKKATTPIAKGTETILLVDDEKMVLEVNKEMLEHHRRSQDHHGPRL